MSDEDTSDEPAEFDSYIYSPDEIVERSIPDDDHASGPGLDALIDASFRAEGNLHNLSAIIVEVDTIIDDNEVSYPPGVYADLLEMKRLAAKHVDYFAAVQGAFQQELESVRDDRAPNACDRSSG